MDQLRFPCSGCSKTLRAPSTAVGRKVRCPSCSAINIVPDAAVSADGSDRKPAAKTTADPESVTSPPGLIGVTVPRQLWAGYGGITLVVLLLAGAAVFMLLLLYRNSGSGLPPRLTSSQIRSLIAKLSSKNPSESAAAESKLVRARGDVIRQLEYALNRKPTPAVRTKIHQIFRRIAWLNYPGDVSKELKADWKFLHMQAADAIPATRLEHYKQLAFRDGAGGLCERGPRGIPIDNQGGIAFFVGTAKRTEDFSYVNGTCHVKSYVTLELVRESAPDVVIESPQHHLYVKIMAATGTHGRSMVPALGPRGMRASAELWAAADNKTVNVTFPLRPHAPNVIATLRGVMPLDVARARHFSLGADDSGATTHLLSWVTLTYAGLKLSPYGGKEAVILLHMSPPVNGQERFVRNRNIAECRWLGMHSSLRVASSTGRHFVVQAQDFFRYDKATESNFRLVYLLGSIKSPSQCHLRFTFYPATTVEGIPFELHHIFIPESPEAAGVPVKPTEEGQAKNTISAQRPSSGNESVTQGSSLQLEDIRFRQTITFHRHTFPQILWGAEMKSRLTLASTDDHHVVRPHCWIRSLCDGNGHSLLMPTPDVAWRAKYYYYETKLNSLHYRMDLKTLAFDEKRAMEEARIYAKAEKRGGKSVLPPQDAAKLAQLRSETNPISGMLSADNRPRQRAIFYGFALQMLCQRREKYFGLAGSDLGSSSIGAERSSAANTMAVIMRFAAAPPPDNRLRNIEVSIPVRHYSHYISRTFALPLKGWRQVSLRRGVMLAIHAPSQYSFSGPEWLINGRLFVFPAPVRKGTDTFQPAIPPYHFINNLQLFSLYPQIALRLGDTFLFSLDPKVLGPEGQNLGPVVLNEGPPPNDGAVSTFMMRIHRPTGHIPRPAKIRLRYSLTRSIRTLRFRFFDGGSVEK